MDEDGSSSTISSLARRSASTCLVSCSSTTRSVTRSAAIDNSSTRHGRSESRTPNPNPCHSSKRVCRSSFDSIDSTTTLGTDAAADTPHQRKLSIPSEQVTYCIEFGLPEALCCHGCYLFATAVVKLSIDNRDHDSRMASALVNRSKNYPGQRKQCLQLWKKSEEDLTSNQLKKLWRDQLRLVF
jgi:hypothetical protein